MNTAIPLISTQDPNFEYLWETIAYSFKDTSRESSTGGHTLYYITHTYKANPNQLKSLLQVSTNKNLSTIQLG